MTVRTALSKRAVLTAAGVVGLTLATAGVAHAATYSLSGTIPAFGSRTFDGNDFYTTAQYNDINFSYTTNPYASRVKPVRCSNLADISGYKDISGNDHGSKVLASSVIDGTCFNVNIDSPTNSSWNFAATIKA